MKPFPHSAEPVSGADMPLLLVVDDDEAMRHLVRTMLEGFGYRVQDADCGALALERVRATRPDLVLLDTQMPGMDGFQCCEHILAIPGAERTPVLMFTGLTDQGSVDRAFAVGATDYVTKPPHWGVLRQRVRRLIQQVQTHRALEESHARLGEAIAKLEQANGELNRLATMDRLTQVANRRAFDEALEREWRRAKRERSPLAIVMADVDYFKRYNDTYGHQEGDDCLRKVAAAMLSVVKRPADCVARYGGEEFVALLPATDALGAMHIAESIRAVVAALGVPHGDSDKGMVTVSLGAASHTPGFPADEAVPDGAHALLKAADKGLYRSKEAGRNRATLMELEASGAVKV